MKHYSSWLKYTTFFDKIILAVCGVLTIGSFFAPLSSAAGDRFRIEIDGVLQHEGTLFSEEQWTFEDSSGRIVVETGERGVRVAASDCPNQICVQQGWRKSNTDIIVCVPNKLVITILGAQTSQQGPLDSITR